MRLSTALTSLASACALGLSASSAFAQQALEIIGQPVDGKMGFQPAATPGAEALQWLEGMILYIISAIVIFVTLLLLCESEIRFV